MNKILVEVFVPAVGKSFDVFISLESHMEDVRKLLCQSVNNLAQGNYYADDDTVVCDAESGIIFNVNMSIYELGLKNGSRLMLI